MKIICWNDRLLTSIKTHTLMLLISGHVDYGVTAVQSPRDAAAAEKNVNEGAKDLIAKYVKLCAQSEVSHKRSSYFFHNLVRVKCGCFTHALSRRIA
jgi:hypothetical protein